MSNKNYTVEELQQLLRMAQEREAEAKRTEPKPIKVGSLVDYLDERGMAHVALVLAIKPRDVLKLKVFRQARSDLVLDNVGPKRWRRR